MGFGLGEITAFAAAPTMALGPVGQYIAQGQQNQANWDLTQSANQASQASADKQMAFQADQVKKQMEFQERMAGSAHQREVEDLKKAGLNPILAANGGAQSPSGSAATGASAKAEVAPYESPLKAGLTSAMETARMALDVAKVNSELGVNKAKINNTNADTARIKQEIKTGGVESEFMDDANEFYKGTVKPGLKNLQQKLYDVNASQENKMKPHFLERSPEMHEAQKRQLNKYKMETYRLKGYP